MLKENLINSIEKYDKSLHEAILRDEETIQNLTNKQIDVCIREQIKLQVDWVKIVNHIIHLYAEAVLQTETEFAKSFRTHHTKSSATLNSSEAKYYASTDLDYIQSKRIENIAYGLKKKAEGILETIESRKFALKDLANLIIAGANSYII